HAALESSASACALSVNWPHVAKSSALRLQAFSGDVPGSPPADWQQMRQRCIGLNGVSGSKAHLCASLDLLDPFLKRRTPQVVVEASLYLKAQKTGAALACGSYKSRPDRSAAVYYTIYYVQDRKQERSYHSVTGS